MTKSRKLLLLILGLLIVILIGEIGFLLFQNRTSSTNLSFPIEVRSEIPSLSASIKDPETLDKYVTQFGLSLPNNIGILGTFQKTTALRLNIVLTSNLQP